MNLRKSRGSTPTTSMIEPLGYLRRSSMRDVVTKDSRGIGSSFSVTEYTTEPGWSLTPRNGWSGALAVLSNGRGGNGGGAGDPRQGLGSVQGWPRVERGIETEGDGH